MTNYVIPRSPPPTLKIEQQIYFLRTVEFANTWQISTFSRNPLPCRLHKYMVPEGISTNATVYFRFNQFSVYFRVNPAITAANHQKKVSNMFKVNVKDTRTTSMT